MRLVGIGVSGGRALGTLHILRDGSADPSTAADGLDTMAALAGRSRALQR